MADRYEFADIKPLQPQSYLPENPQCKTAEAILDEVNQGRQCSLAQITNALQVEARKTLEALNKQIAAGNIPTFEQGYESVDLPDGTRFSVKIKDSDGEHAPKETDVPIKITMIDKSRPRSDGYLGSDVLVAYSSDSGFGEYRRDNGDHFFSDWSMYRPWSVLFGNKQSDAGDLNALKVIYFNKTPGELK